LRKTTLQRAGRAGAGRREVKPGTARPLRKPWACSRRTVSELKGGRTDRQVKYGTVRGKPAARAPTMRTASHAPGLPVAASGPLAGFWAARKRAACGCGAFPACRRPRRQVGTTVPRSLITFMHTPMNPAPLRRIALLALPCVLTFAAASRADDDLAARVESVI